MPGIGDKYRIIAAGAGWRRRTERGRLRIGGADRASFLQALLTNEIAALKAGQGCYAAYLTPQGRMIADLHVFIRGDHIIADVPASGAQALGETLDRLIFAEDVSIENVSAAWGQISVVGGSADQILGAAAGVSSLDLRGLPLWSQIDFGTGFVARNDDATLPGYDVILPAGDEARFIDALGAAGAQPIDDELHTSMRVDAGRPEFGRDMDSETIPLEAGLLDRAISTTKGCYVGQEVIIRVLHRGGGRVARRLVKLSIDSAEPPLAAGTKLRDGEREAGVITSVGDALDGTGRIALASVRRDIADSGGALTTDTTPPSTVTIAALAG